MRNTQSLARRAWVLTTTNKQALEAAVGASPAVEISRGKPYGAREVIEVVKTVMEATGQDSSKGRERWAGTLGVETFSASTAWGCSDDAPDIRDLLVTVLDEYGASVTAVGLVPEALDSIQRELPNVLVSDLAMAGQDGHSLISKVRALPPERGGQTPAAALTGDIGAGARVLLAGFQFHIQKPVDVYQLVGVVALLAPSRSKVGRRPSPPVLFPPTTVIELARCSARSSTIS